MSINLKQISSLFTSLGSTDVNLKSVANFFNSSYSNNVSMNQMFKLQGDSNLYLSSSVANYAQYDGQTQLTINYRIKYDKQNDTGLFFKDIFDYQGTLSSLNIINDIWITNNAYIQISSQTNQSIDAHVNIVGVSGALEGSVVQYTLNIELSQDFYKFANMSSNLLTFTQYLKYQQQPIT